jgi:Peptidylarginine deiminase and related enzymes
MYHIQMGGVSSLGAPGNRHFNLGVDLRKRCGPEVTGNIMVVRVYMVNFPLFLDPKTDKGFLQALMDDLWDPGVAGVLQERIEIGDRAHKACAVIVQVDEAFSEGSRFRLSPSSVRMERIDLGSWADVEADHGVLQRLATAIRSQALKACQNRNDREARRCGGD